MASKQHPFELLQELERESKKYAKGLPQQTETRSLWTGIGFRLGDIEMVAPLTQVNEILHIPKLTLVPGTLPWIKGLANIRGTLLPIVDLQSYLGQRPIHVRQQSRILVIHQGELDVGLLVDEVIGLRHFDPEERVSRIRKMEPAVKSHIRGAFQQNKKIWHLFDMTTLIDDPQFYKVAV
ncbi:MAG TPA: purine-binding chemotaxis protein CheW [Gammaproteobacteria bacterium]|nr:purine-binding chemotaxis protein CheW [Gammaproteobacteria bacterium]